jgi:hypothetical protein
MVDLKPQWADDPKPQWADDPKPQWADDPKPQWADEKEAPEFSMDDLDIKQDWIQQAKTIYKHEEQEDFKGTDKEVSEWFKDRHSALSHNLTNLGMTAISSKNMPDVVKDAWLKSLKTYEDTDSDLFSIGRAVKNLAKDPLTWATAVGGIGVGGVAKLLGTKTASKIGIEQLKKYLVRFNFKEQVAKELTKKVGLKAAQEFAKKGTSKAVTKEVLTGARKKAAKDIAKLSTFTGSAAGAGWGGGFDLAQQALEVEIDPEKDEIDAGQTAIAAIISAAAMGTAGRYLPKVTEKIARDRAIRKAQEVRATPKTTDFVENNIIKDNNDTSFRETAVSRALVASDSLEVDGNITINIDYPLTKPQTETLIDAYKNKGIILTTQDGKTFTGKKTIQVSDVVDDSLLPERTWHEQWLARIGRNIRDDSNLGRAFKLVRRQFDRTIPQIEKNIQRRFERLTKAIKKDYNVNNVNELEPDELKILNRYLEGDQVALKVLQDRGLHGVIKEIDGMREHIKHFQEKLLDPEKGIIKENEEGQLLRAKIQSSIDDDGELYLTRQYEVFDNPNWKSDLARSPEGTEIIKNAKQFLRDNHKSRVGLTEYIRNRKQYEKQVDEDLLNILTANNEEDILQVFKPVNDRWKGKKPSLILTERGTIPEQIRLLMGEYKDPFTNYANTVTRLFKTIETHDYEKRIARLINEDKIAGITQGHSLGKMSVPLRTSLVRNVDSRTELQKIHDLLKLGDTEDLTDEEVTKRLKEIMEKEAGISQPLEEGNWYAYPEVASAIAEGTEIAPVINRAIGEYIRLQSYTRAAKTVYSPSAIARNFLGSGMMALGAGYLNPRKLPGIIQVFKGLSKLADDDLRAEMEKGIRLGYIQTGVDLNAFKGALQDAGDVNFWKLSSPLYKGSKALVNKAKNANTSVIKLYQSMDDAWKQLGFLNERDTQRQILLDTLPSHEKPDDIVDSFLSADGKRVDITRLDVIAANKVSDKMQNYAGVSRAIKYTRRLPFADFIAFTTELARTTKNIIRDAFIDFKRGQELMKRGEKAVDSNGVETGLLKGEKQYRNGLKSLGSIGVGIGIIPALSKTSSYIMGLDDTAIDPDTGRPLPYTMRQGIEGISNAEWEEGSNFIYFGDPKDIKNPLRGRRLNLSYLNPWAKATDAITAAFRAFDRGENVDNAISDSLIAAVWNPIKETLGPSMAAELIWDTLYKHQDEYGKPLYDKNDSNAKKILNTIGQSFMLLEPGGSKALRDIRMSLSNPESVKAETYGSAEPDMFGLTKALLPEGRKRSGVRSGKTGRRYYAQDQLTGLFGIKPQTYNLKTDLGLKFRLLKKELTDTTKPFKDIYQDRSIRTSQEFLDSYRESLERSYAISTRVFDLITKAKAAGFTKKDIYNSMTDGGLFKKRYDKKIFKNILEEGTFQPAVPNFKDIKKWAISTQGKTGSTSLTRDLIPQLMEIHRQYINRSTGIRFRKEDEESFNPKPQWRD